MIKENETLDEYCKRRFKNFSDKALVSRINAAPDFGWDDEGHELGRRIKASNGKLKVEMNINTMIIV